MTPCSALHSLIHERGVISVPDLSRFRDGPGMRELAALMNEQRMDPQAVGR
jgi:hypothetical protein